MLIQSGLIINEYLNKFLINNTYDYSFFYKNNTAVDKQYLNNNIRDILYKEFFADFDV